MYKMPCGNWVRHRTIRTVLLLEDAQQIIDYISHFTSSARVFKFRQVQYGAATLVF